MKYVKTFGLVAVAMTALVAMTGTASATILTSPSGTTYTSTIKAENSGPIVLTSAFGGFGAIQCNKSSFEGKIEAHGASVTARTKLSLLTFQECTGGEWTSPVVTAGSLEFHGTSTTGNATVTSLNASMVLHKTVFGTCTFTTSSTGTDTGTLTGSNITGGNAVLDIAAVIPSPCGNATWEGKYKVVTPTKLEVH